MNKYLIFTTAILILLGNVNCSKTKKGPAQIQEALNVVEEVPENEISEIEIGKNPADFVPKGYVIFDTIYGDLNKDKIEDCVLIIKGTNKSEIVKDEYRGELDRNRRGIIVLLNKNKGYELAVKNYDCFSSENEEGGVYFAPELGVEITKGKLFVHYAHGRYGYWRYMFRLQNSDLELIGYDASSNHGPTVLTETSINFLTRKKIVNENANPNIDEPEMFEKKETKINKIKLLKLSEIEDFDKLEVSEE
ncbi:hypothetical protein NJT12_00445 [Flavobacterium sp. AC]|uniref:Lipoprotein n=1 Tax=Flavobacterium azizsancarii TaxID=2961580 RepID=A0ABT4W708_9FLAO|nr:hypothetical protein [Flavobacterium azizsancarii]MDA6068072.1 hypothetical protein [Flavobacterium azizsancarii]